MKDVERPTSVNASIVAFTVIMNNEANQCWRLV
jgi:hypothetical protein